MARPVRYGSTAGARFPASCRLSQESSDVTAVERDAAPVAPCGAPVPLALEKFSGCAARPRNAARPQFIGRRSDQKSE